MKKTLLAGLAGGLIAGVIVAIDWGTLNIGRSRKRSIGGSTALEQAEEIDSQASVKAPVDHRRRQT